MSELRLTLNVFDEVGEMTGETKAVSLSLEALADIVDHATQLSILQAKGLDSSDVLIELAEVIEVYGLSNETPTAQSSHPKP